MIAASHRWQASALDVGSALLRAWWVVVLSVVVGAVAGAGVALSLPERYVGSVTLLVQLPQGANDTEALVRTVEALANSTVVLGDIAERPGVDLSAAEIADRMIVDRAAGSAVLEVSLVDTSAQQVRIITEQLAPALRNRLDEVSSDNVVSSDGEVASLPIRVVPFGGEPYVRPKARQPEVTAALCGVALGLVAAVVITARVGGRTARPPSHRRGRQGWPPSPDRSTGTAQQELG